MLPRERELALEVLSVAWQRVAEGGELSILAMVRDEAAALPARYADVDTDFAEQRAVNLARFAAEAEATDVERLFAVAVALNSADV